MPIVKERNEPLEDEDLISENDKVDQIPEDPKDYSDSEGADVDFLIEDTSRDPRRSAISQFCKYEY